MSILFTPAKINSLELKNRFIRSATWEGMATQDGYPTKKLIDLLVNLAQNEVGLIITGHTYVILEGRTSPWQLAIYDDKFIPSLKDMVKAVHDAGGKIAVQLTHAGCFGAYHLTKLTPLGPSCLDKEGLHHPCREMSIEDIKRTIHAFVKGAVRAREAGFDAVQLHGAHGYLLSQFLSPFFNKRDDLYGGPLENRARIIFEIIEGIRKEVGKDYPLFIKINCDDFLEKGLKKQEAVDLCVMLEQRGIDAIEISGGTKFSGKFLPVRKGDLKSTEDEVYYKDAASMIKKRLKIPLILVGGIRSFEVAESCVKNNLADFIALSRPLICEPDLIKRWKEGDRRRSECKSDNLCFRPAFEGKGIFCVRKERKKNKK